jgi:Holliday junction resolvase RusA-like endonuclease
MFVNLRIYVARPADHYGTGRNAGKLKPNVPAFPATGLDIDKVTRACLDAGTVAGWWTNDSRVARCSIARYYDAEERVEVVAWPLGPVSLNTSQPTPTAERAATPRGRVAR